MNSMIAGVDEVGRGALFGPVVAGAVVLTDQMAHQLKQQGVTDSKKLTALQRDRLYDEILSSAIDCRIGIGSVWEIDRINILQASLLAMHRAIRRLTPQPTLCLVDGNQAIPHLSIPQQTIIQGDQNSTHIAAASIVAKVWRDRLIIRLSKRFPGYDLCSNKGYGTLNHRIALESIGVSTQHRLSFKTCQQAIAIDT
ncbi:MAG: ribonuclease HII [Cyanobacteria bacterium P01_E01_bin.6]